jgi:hypothetical protein
MIPVDQTRLYVPDDPQAPPGNCWAAALASILEVPLDRVPDELEFWSAAGDNRAAWEKYQCRMHEWLLAEHAVVLVEVKTASLTYSGPLWCWGTMYSVIVGPSPRDARVCHAAVGLAGKIVHDPYPSRAGLAGHWSEWSHELLVRAYIKIGQ